MKLVAAAMLATALGGCNGPREPMAVKFLDGCTQPQIALVAEGMRLWNEACGGGVFRFAEDGDPIGDVRVLCSDEADFGDSALGNGIKVSGYYSPSEGKVVVPSVETIRDVARMPVLAAHELGHAAGLGHRDDATSIMRPVYATEMRKPSPSDVAALREVGFRCDWSGE